MSLMNHMSFLLCSAMQKFNTNNLPEILVMNGREDVWVNSRLEEEISDRKLFYVQPGGVGFAFQNVFNMDATISNAEVCVAPCKDDAGNEYVLGDTIQQGGKNCICRRRGFVCTEEPQECGEEMECGEGLTRWVDPETCETKCIPREFFFFGVVSNTSFNT